MKCCKNGIVLFTDGDVNIEVQINPEQETVWLTQKQMEVLFDVKHATVSEHISNILASGELDENSVVFSDRSTRGRKYIGANLKYYFTDLGWRLLLSDRLL